MNRPMYYYRDGTPIADLPHKQACIVWAELLEGERRVCSTKFWWGGWLSTVYLGLDHNFGDGEPLIFESMLFFWPHKSILLAGEKVRSIKPECGCWRYADEKEAIRGHSSLVRKYKVPRLSDFCGWLLDWFEGWERCNADQTGTWSLFSSWLSPTPLWSLEDLRMKSEEVWNESRDV